MTTRHTFAALACSAVLSGAAHADVAAGEDSLPIERFRPVVDDTGLGTTEGGDVADHLAVHTGFIFDYALDPLVVTDAQGKRVASVVANRLGGTLVANVGLFDIGSLGLELPLALLQNSGALGPLAPVTGGAGNFAVSGVGDLKLVPKVRLLNDVVAVSFIPTLSLPTASGIDFAAGSFAYERAYLGEGPGALSLTPELALSTQIGAVRLAADASWHLRAPVFYLHAFTMTSELGYHVGAGVDAARIVPAADGLFVWLELFGATSDHDPFGLASNVVELSAAQQELKDIEVRLQNPLEWSLGGRYDIDAVPGLSAEGGLGAGLLPGYGSPDLRLFAGVRYVFEKRDPDGDGLFDDEDKCPNEPEDKDGFEDGDGCPDVDNDNDSIPDDEDQCPDTPGLPADHGCPPPDADGDGIPDAHDPCPNEAGPEALGGCPDGDGDGIIDANDACPDIPGPPERRGCPPPPDKDGDGVPDDIDQCPDAPGTILMDGCGDADHDGIGDNVDKCPNDPETVNGVDDADGCPDTGKVVVKEGKVEVLEPLLFDLGKATIKKQSNPVLDALAQLMIAHPEMRLSIEGHTDNVGDPEKNLDLSEHRAAAVRDAIVARNVDDSRITSIGYGDTRPVAPNETARGRSKNRRVELIIVPPNAPPPSESSSSPHLTPSLSPAPAPEQPQPQVKP